MGLCDEEGGSMATEADGDFHVVRHRQERSPTGQQHRQHSCRPAARRVPGRVIEVARPATVRKTSGTGSSGS